MKRPDENPPSRYPARPLAEAGARWWIAKVKPRMEKACAWDFLRDAIEYYLPLYTKTVRRADNNKPRKSILPLFSGYIAFAMEQPYNVYTHGRLVSIVEVRNQKKFIRELTQIQSALETGVAITPLDSPIGVGETVEVRHGPLRGLVGTVSRQSTSGHRLVLEVEGLGMATIAIESSWVSPVS